MPPWSNGRSKRPLYAAVGVWLAYLLVLIVADYAAVYAGTNTHLLPAPYYIFQLLIALSVLALSMSSWASARLGRAFLPSVILLMAAMPLVATAATVPSFFPGPLTGSGGTIVLRALPMLTLALVLTAWQYRMRHVFLFCVATATLFMLVHLRSSSSPLRAASLAATQGMGLLVLGYYVKLEVADRTQAALLAAKCGVIERRRHST